MAVNGRCDRLLCAIPPQRVITYHREMADVTEVAVEFYGVPRQRAGVERVGLVFSTCRVKASDVIGALVQRFPALRDGCLQDGWLHPACAANVDGVGFISDPSTLLSTGQTLLVMSADAGG